jgi:hypothetical protein
MPPSGAKVRCRLPGFWGGRRTECMDGLLAVVSESCRAVSR